MKYKFEISNDLIGDQIRYVTLFSAFVISFIFKGVGETIQNRKYNEHACMVLMVLISRKNQLHSATGFKPA